MQTLDIDPLVPIDRWPGIRCSCCFRGPAGAPVLRVLLRQDAARYTPEPGESAPCEDPPSGTSPGWQRRALRDEELLTLIAAQIGAVRGTSRPPVTMAVASSLMAGSGVQLDDAARAAIRAFVAGALRHVAARARCQEGESVPECSVDIPVGALVAEDVLKLTASITLARLDAQADPAHPEIGFGSAVTSDIPFEMAGESGRGGLRSFADDFEAAFASSAVRLRIGVSGSVDEGSAEIWSIRLGREKGEGIAFEIETEPGFFALQPLGAIFGNRTASIAPYASGESFPSGAPSQQVLTAIDLDRWRSAALGALDDLLLPNRSASVRLLDRLLFEHPEREGYLPRLMAHRSTLADTLAASVVPLFLEEISGSAQRTAIDGARRAFHRRLGLAAAPATAVALTVIDNRSAASRGSAASDLRLLGTVSGSGVGEGNPGVIELTASDATDGACLGFLCTFPSTRGTSPEARGLSFALEGIEIVSQGIALTLVTGAWVTPIGAGPIDIPVPLVGTPIPPTIRGVAASQIVGGVGTARASAHDLATYSFSMHYDCSAAGQDVCEVTISPEPLHPSRPQDVTVSAPLFDALAQFVAVHPAIMADVQAGLAALTAESTREQILRTRNGVDAFERIVAEVAAACAAEPVRTPSGLPEALPDGAYRFAILTRKDGDAARLDILSIAGAGASAATPIPAVVIGEYESVPVPAAEGAVASYRYRDADGTFMEYERAIELSRRTLTISPFDFGAWPQIWGSARVHRNTQLLAEMVTAPPFLMSSPVIGMSEASIPRLSYDRVDLGTTMGAPARLATYLDTFFKELCGGGHAFVLDLEGSYSYDLVGMRVSLPVFLLPGFHFTPVAGAPLPFAADVERQVLTWLQMVPDVDGRGEISFDVTISVVAAGELQPLLTISDLFIDMARVKRD